ALAQVTADDEVIVADDGSTDNTAEALAEFQGRIRHLPLPHGGAGATRNRGVAQATRPLIAFLDSDDEWLPGKLKLQRTFLERRCTSRRICRCRRTRSVSRGWPRRGRRPTSTARPRSSGATAGRG